MILTLRPSLKAFKSLDSLLNEKFIESNCKLHHVSPLKCNNLVRSRMSSFKESPLHVTRKVLWIVSCYVQVNNLSDKYSPSLRTFSCTQIFRNAEVASERMQSLDFIFAQSALD